MTLHLEGIHICHILKQWLQRPVFKYMKILVKMVYLEGICMVEADTMPIKHGGPKGSCGRTTIGSCKVEIRDARPLMCSLLS